MGRVNVAHAIKLQQSIAFGQSRQHGTDSSHSLNTPRPYNRIMPELPDLLILADAFSAALVGRTVVAAEAPGA